MLKPIVLKKLPLAALLFLLAVLGLGGSRHYQQLPALAQRLSSGDHLVLANLARHFARPLRRLADLSCVASWQRGRGVTRCCCGSLPWKFYLSFGSA